MTSSIFQKIEKYVYGDGADRMVRVGKEKTLAPLLLYIFFCEERFHSWLPIIRLTIQIAIIRLYSSRFFRYKWNLFFFLLYSWIVKYGHIILISKSNSPDCINIYQSISYHKRKWFKFNILSVSLEISIEIQMMHFHKIMSEQHRNRFKRMPLLAFVHMFTYFSLVLFCSKTIFKYVTYYREKKIYKNAVVQCSVLGMFVYIFCIESIGEWFECCEVSITSFE